MREHWGIAYPLAPFSQGANLFLVFTGDTSGIAQIGTHAAIGIELSDGSSFSATAFGSSQADVDASPDYGTGAAPTDFTAADGGSLWAKGTYNGKDYYGSISVRYAAPVNTVLPAITGGTTVGSTLTCSTGTWTGSNLTYSFQWYRGGTMISGATASTYLTTASDEGFTLTCVVTASNSGGSPSATSNGVAITAAASGSIDSVVLDDPNNEVDVTLTSANGPLTVYFGSSTQAQSPTFDGTTWTGTLHENTSTTGVSAGTTAFANAVTGSTPYGAQRLTVYFKDSLGTLFGPTVLDYTHDAVPDAFVDANWSVATGSAANELDVTIASLPSANGNAITDVEYRIGGAGAYTSLGATSGTITITMAAASTSYALDLRAVNGEGNGPAGNSESATSGAAAASFAISDSAATNPSGNGSSISVNTPTHTSISHLLTILGGEEGWMTGSAPTNHAAQGQIEAYATSGRSEGKAFLYDATVNGVLGATVDFSSVLTNSKERGAVMLALDNFTAIGANTLNVDNSVNSNTNCTSPTVSGTAGRKLLHIWILSGTDAITAPAGITVLENITGNTVSILVGVEDLSTTGTTTGRTATVGTARSWATAVIELY